MIDWIRFIFLLSLSTHSCTNRDCQAGHFVGVGSLSCCQALWVGGKCLDQEGKENHLSKSSQDGPPTNMVSFSSVKKQFLLTSIILHHKCCNHSTLLVTLIWYFWLNIPDYYTYKPLFGWNKSAYIVSFEGFAQWNSMSLGYMHSVRVSRLSAEGSSELLPSVFVRRPSSVVRRASCVVVVRKLFTFSSSS